MYKILCYLLLMSFAFLTAFGQKTDSVDPVMLKYSMDDSPKAGAEQMMDATGKITGSFFQMKDSPLPKKASGANSKTGSSWDFSQTDTSFDITVGDSPLKDFGNIEKMPGMTIVFWHKPPSPMRPRSMGTIASMGKVFSIKGNENFRGESPLFSFGEEGKTQVLGAAASPAAQFMKEGKWRLFGITMDYSNPLGKDGTTRQNVLTYVDGKTVNGYPGKGPQVFTFTKSFMPEAKDKLVFSPKDRKKQRQFLDEVTIFNYALNPEEMKHLFEEGSLNSHAPQVIANASRNIIVLEENPHLKLSGEIENFRQNLEVKTNWSVESSPEGGSVSFVDPTMLKTSANISGPSGTYILKLTASNGKWQNDSYIKLTVYFQMPVATYASAGGRPSADIIINKPVELNGAYRLLDDRNPEETKYSWSKVSGPGEVIFSKPSSQNSQVTISEPGEYTLQLEAAKGKYKSSAKVTLTAFSEMLTKVAPYAETPIIRWPQQSTELSVEVVQSNPNKQLTYQWRKVKGPGTVMFSDPASANPTVTCLQEGVYQYAVKVSNGSYNKEAFCWINIWPQDEGSISGIIPPKPRRLSPQPEPYVHPRYLFAEADRAEITYRVKNDDFASGSFKKLKGEVQKTLMNPDHPLGIAYKKLLINDRQFSIRSLRRDLWKQIAFASFVAWIEKDHNLLTDLSLAAANAARDEMKWRKDNRSGHRHEMAVAYDLLFNSMSEDQRVDVRKLFAYLCKGKIVDRFHWQYLDGYLGIYMAIYGEEGFDEKSALNNVESIKYSLNGWTTTPLGWNMEDTAYGGLYGHNASLCAMAISRQIEPLYITSGMTRWNQMDFYMWYPPTTAHKHTQLGGHSEGGTPHSAAKVLINRYLYPNNQMEDFTLGAYRSRGRSGGKLFDAIFGIDRAQPAPTFASAAKQRNLPLTKFDPQRGLAVARSDWSADGLVLDFDCRYDVFDSGHIHANRNEFTLYSNGVNWFPNPGYGRFDNKDHSTIAIDGQVSHRIPGKFTEAIINENYNLFVGDAKLAYEFNDFVNPRYKRSSGDNKNFDTGLKWRDLFFPGSRDGKISKHIPPPLRHRESYQIPDTKWMDYPVLVPAKDGQPKYYKPMKKAFRSAMLIRGEMPYVLIFDDIQKDDKQRVYQWQANVSKNTLLRPGTTSAKAMLYQKTTIDKKTEKHLPEAEDHPQMLVQVIEARGEGSTMTLGMQNGKNLLKLQHKTDCPDFKVLLIPHRKNEQLPNIEYKENKLTVGFSNGQIDTLNFLKHEDGRTRVKFKRTK